MNGNGEFLTISQFANRLAISRTAVRYLMKRGKIEYERKGVSVRAHILIPSAELKKFSGHSNHKYLK